MSSYYPEEWSDSQRMTVLMKPMPADKSSAAYKGKLSFWTRTIYNFLHIEKKTTFRAQELLTIFQYGSQQPQCIEDVVNSLVSDGKVVKIESFWQLSTQKPQSWWSLPSVVFKINPIKAVWDLAQKSYNSDQIFVDLQAAEEIGSQITKIYWLSSLPKISPVHTLKDLFSIVHDCVSSMEDLQVALHYLFIHNKVDLLVHKNETFVKFANPGQTSRPQIEHVEIATYELKNVEERINAKISTVSKEISEMRIQAKKYIEIKQTIMAKQCLRKKLRLESQLTSLLSTLDNITGTLDKIQQAEMSKDVLSAYQSGLHSLQRSLASTGSLESINTLMTDLQDTFDDYDNIMDTVTTDLEPMDVEKELDELVSEISLQFPAIPQSDPLSQTQPPGTASKLPTFES